MDGVVYVAYGARAVGLARKSLASLRGVHGDGLPAAVISDKRPGLRARWVEFAECNGATAPGRWAKVNLDNLTPWDRTLFLDADTMVYGDLSAGFRLLALGADLVLVPSEPQDGKAFGHLQDKERAATFKANGGSIQLNTGVMWFGESAGPLFDVWREEWARWRDKDQGALVRALERRPVAVRILGRPFNASRPAGAAVHHLFGAAK